MKTTWTMEPISGVEFGSVGESPIGRYVHFTAPDGHLYELVEVH